jgi:monoamine oxidase
MTARGKIVVVGAGVAGLSAARALVDAGAEVVVVEGRDRVGGRVWTDRSTGLPIDMGASWIHGVEGNPITALAEGAGIRTHATTYENVHLYDDGGARVSNDDLEDAWEAWEELGDAAEELAEDLDEDISVGDALQRALGGDALSPRERRIHDWFVRSLVTTAAGEDPARLSARFSDDDDEFDGGDRLFPGGYHQIVELIANGLDVRTGQPVARVEVTDRGVAVHTATGVHEGERAVITLPLGVLQKGSVQFSPALPADKLAAIRSLAMGTLDKVALRFPRVFWPTAPDFLGYAASAPDAFPEFMNAHRFLGEPVLMAFCGGDAARSLEPRSDAEIVGRALAILRTIVGRAVPDPTHVTVSRWHGDPFSFGSYSYVPVGADSRAYDVLAAPVGDRLFFAGEATSRRYRGTVHGAYLSGLAAARRIAALAEAG